MNDLDQINRNNAAAIQRCIPELLAKGHFVVEERAGLHFVGCENFSGEGARERAEAKLEELNASGNSTHGILHVPADASLPGAEALIPVSEVLSNFRAAGEAAGAIHRAQLHAGINDDHLAQRFGLSA